MSCAIDADKLAVGGRVARDLIVMLAAIGVRGQMLTAVLQPAHRMIGVERQPSERDLLAAEQSLVAEAAADIGRNNAQAPVLDPKTFAQSGLHRMRKLRRGDQRQ